MHLGRPLFLIGLATPCVFGFAHHRPDRAAEFRPTPTAAPQVQWNSPHAAAWASAGGGSSRVQLPKSTRDDPPGTLGRCSVENENPAKTCSANASSASGRCSAEVDRGAFCSAYWTTGNPGTSASCSTQAANNAQCSVGRVRPGGGGAAAECSASGGPAGTSTVCSTLVPNTTGQFCSSDNMGTGANRCSAVDGTGGVVQCSVLAPSSSNRCSVNGAGAGGDTCSVYLSNTFCSILQTGSGARCTAFNGAAAGKCSANGIGNAHCSVFGGGGPQQGICQ